MHTPENLLRIMSFNVRCIGVPVDDTAWEDRRDTVARVIGAYGATVAGLQEPARRQIDDLLARVPGYGWFGAGRLDGRDEGEFTPIFYRQERIQVLEQSTFWLSERPEMPGSMGWDATCPRIVTWGRLRDRLTNRMFFHFNTHFDHNGERARLESARQLLAAIARIAGAEPLVVTGDFNCTESSVPYRLLTQGEPSDTCRERLRLMDARHAALLGHTGPDFTFNALDDSEPVHSKIDYIFTANGVQVLRHEILSDTSEGRFPSDHLPVVAELAIG